MSEKIKIQDDQEDSIKKAAEASKRRLRLTPRGKLVATGLAAASVVGVGAGVAGLDEATKTETAQVTGFIEQGDGTQAAFNRAMDEAAEQADLNRNHPFVGFAEEEAHANLHKDLVDSGGNIHPGQNFTVTTYKGGLLGLPYVDAHENESKSVSKEDSPNETMQQIPSPTQRSSEGVQLPMLDPEDIKD